MNKEIKELDGFLRMLKDIAIPVPKPVVPVVKPMLHYYRDNTTATLDHMFNMINTYGKDHVNSIIDELRKTGAL